MSEKFIGYMCGVDFQHEQGRRRKGNLIFATKEACEKHKKCTHECGIVEVTVTLKRWVKNQQLLKK